MPVRLDPASIAEHLGSRAEPQKDIVLRRIRTGRLVQVKQWAVLLYAAPGRPATTLYLSPQLGQVIAVTELAGTAVSTATLGRVTEVDYRHSRSVGFLRQTARWTASLRVTRDAEVTSSFLSTPPAPRYYIEPVEA